MKIKVYVEGGGQTRFLKSKCREGFRTFLNRAGVEDGRFGISACGSRQDAYSDFCVAIRNAKEADFIVLLMDSEAAVAAGKGPWAHLHQRDGWAKPKAATDDNAHLMVQCMEAWFLADKDALAAFFGNGFQRNAIPARAEIEDILKDDVFNGLKTATRRCTPKGEYGKGRHSFDILAQIDPGKVIAVSPEAKRLVDTLLQKAEA